MENQTAGFLVDGFAFYSEEAAEIAAKELQGVNYIKGKTDFDEIEMVYQVYNKIMEQQMFQTPIGIRFLVELQNMLFENPFIKDEDIKPLNIDQILKIESIKNENERLRKWNRQIKEENKGFEGKKSKIKEKKLISRLQISYIVNVGLIIGMIIMMIIAGTSNNPRITNYETDLQNKYASWEQKLIDRENIIREKEKELSIKNE